MTPHHAPNDPSPEGEGPPLEDLLYPWKPTEIRICTLGAETQIADLFNRLRTVSLMLLRVESVPLLFDNYHSDLLDLKRVYAGHTEVVQEIDRCTSAFKEAFLQDADREKIQQIQTNIDDILKRREELLQSAAEYFQLKMDPGRIQKIGPDYFSGLFMDWRSIFFNEISTSGERVIMESAQILKPLAEMLIAFNQLGYEYEGNAEYSNINGFVEDLQRSLKSLGVLNYHLHISFLTDTPSYVFSLPIESSIPYEIAKTSNVGRASYETQEISLAILKMLSGSSPDDFPVDDAHPSEVFWGHIRRSFSSQEPMHASLKGDFLIDYFPWTCYLHDMLDIKNVAYIPLEEVFDENIVKVAAPDRRTEHLKADHFVAVRYERNGIPCYGVSRRKPIPNDLLRRDI